MDKILVAKHQCLIAGYIAIGVFVVCFVVSVIGEVVRGIRFRRRFPRVP